MNGRKPVPANLINAQAHKKAGEEIEARKNIEKNLKAKATLRCPDYLSDLAKKEWGRIMKLYRSLKVDILSDLDIQPLVMYCEATAIYKKAQETWVELNKVVGEDLEQQYKLNKCFAIMEKQTRIISGLSEQLCLTPVGRARMGMLAAKQAEDDPSDLDHLINNQDD